MLTLRQVYKGDCRLLWEWANDPAVRTGSFSIASIPWKRHLEWFQSKLEDPDCLFYVVVDGQGTPIGQARYDISDNEAVISISIAKDFRGRGYGGEIIRIGSEHVFKVSNATIIHAYIKQSNVASTKAFFKAGFRAAGLTTIRGYRAVDLILNKET